MRLNRRNTLIRMTAASAALLSAGALLLLLFCSRSDVILDAGRSVVEGVDSALIAAPGRAFWFVSVDSLFNRQDIVDTAFARSLPETRDPLFSTYANTGSVIVGVSADGDTLAAHAQFTAQGGDSLLYYVYSNTTTFDSWSAYVYFRAEDTAAAGDPFGRITLFRCDTLEESAPADMAAAKASSDTVASFTPGGGGAIDSVKLPDSIAKRLFDVKKSSDTSKVQSFAFSIADYIKKPLKLNDPYIIITVKAKDSRTKDSAEIRDDNIRSFVRYTVFENADSVKQRAARAYSSQHTRRTAVIRMNMQSVFASLAVQKLPVDSCEILNAVAALQPNLSESRNAPAYSAFASDELWTGDMLRDSANTAFARAGGSVKPKEPPYYNTHDFKAAMRGVIEKYNSRSADYKPYIYIYLRPAGNAAEGGVIVWDWPFGPLKIETVFTHSR